MRMQMNRLEKRALLNKIAMAAKAVLVRRGIYKKAEEGNSGLGQVGSRKPDWYSRPQRMPTSAMFAREPGGTGFLESTSYMNDPENPGNDPNDSKYLYGRWNYPGMPYGIETYGLNQGGAGDEHPNLVHYRFNPETGEYLDTEPISLDNDRIESILPDWDIQRFKGNAIPRKR